MANSVFPQPALPHTSVGLPRGKPPCVISSKPGMPVGALGRIQMFEFRCELAFEAIRTVTKKIHHNGVINCLQTPSLAPLRTKISLSLLSFPRVKPGRHTVIPVFDITKRTNLRWNPFCVAFFSNVERFRSISSPDLFLRRVEVGCSNLHHCSFGSRLGFFRICRLTFRCRR